MNILIRNAEIKDQDIINNFLEKLLHYEAINYDKNTRQDAKINSYYNNKIGIKPYLILVAEIDNKVVGYIYGRRLVNLLHYHKEAIIEHLYIEEEYRNQHIGTKLINSFTDIVKEEGIKFIHIDNYEKNTIAKNLYTKLGFNIMNEKRRKEI